MVHHEMIIMTALRWAVQGISLSEGYLVDFLEADTDLRIWLEKRGWCGIWPTFPWRIWSGFLNVFVFQMVCQVWVLYRAKRDYPLPMTWILDDFSLFIFDPFCFRIFYDYIQETRPELLDDLDHIVLISLYKLDDSKEAYTKVSKSIGGEDATQYSKSCLEEFDERMEKLAIAFHAYKETKSYLALKEKIMGYERLTTKMYGIGNV